MIPTLAIRGLTCRRGAETVLRSLDLEVSAGELLLIQGPNGSGKSTLLEAIVGLVPSSGGEVRLDGRRIDRWSSDRIAVAGVVLVHQLRHLFSSLTVRENLEMANFAGRRSGVPLAPVASWLERFGIAGLADKTAGLLSGGEQRLVAIARGLRSCPQVALLDEPLAALSEEARDRVLAELRVVAQAGAAVIIIEHDSDRVLPLVDRALALRDGHLVESRNIVEVG